MAKRYLTIDTFNGGLVTNSDPANLGGVASKVLKNFRIDKHGTLVSRKRRDHIKSIDDATHINNSPITPLPWSLKQAIRGYIHR